VRLRDRPRLRLAQRGVAGVVVVLVGALLAGLVATWVLAARRIDGTSVVGLDPEPEDVRNIVVGLAPDGDSGVDGVFLLQVGPARPDPAVLVLPAALEVDVAGEGVLTLSQASARAGMAALVEEVGDYTDLDIHHYVRVDRAALGQAIDENGGIEDCPTPDAPACPNVLGSDVIASLAPPEGAVSGRDRVVALAEAASLVGGEVARPRTLLDPRRALRWADAWDEVLRTDVDPGPGGARDLARALAAFDPARLQVRVLPGLIDEGRVSVAPEEAAVLLAAFTDVSPLPDDIGIEAPRELTPQDITVQVLNGVGEAGAAGEMATFLAERGFTVAETDNAPRFDPRAPTTVGYADEEDRLLAELVASFLPGAELRELVNPPPEGIQVVVTVGADGTG
jgi:hypothetical protein